MVVFCVFSLNSVIQNNTQNSMLLKLNYLMNFYSKGDTKSYSEPCETSMMDSFLK